MDNWSGVYQHVSDENFEAYERARGLSDNQLAVIVSQHPIVEIRQDGTDFYMKTTLNLRPVQELRFQLGREWYTNTPDGRKISNVFFAQNSRLIQRQTDEYGNYIEYIREFIGDCMYLILTRQGITARRCFKKVPGF